MPLRNLSPEESNRLDDACRIADHVFLYALDCTARGMDIKDYDPEVIGQIRSVYDKHTQLVTGFMQTIATIYASEEVQYALAGVEKKLQDLDLET